MQTCAAVAAIEACDTFEVTSSATHEDFEKKCTGPFGDGLRNLTLALGKNLKSKKDAEDVAADMGQKMEKRTKGKNREAPEAIEKEIKDGKEVEGADELKKDPEKENSDERVQKANASNQVLKDAIVHVVELKSHIGSKVKKRKKRKNAFWKRGIACASRIISHIHRYKNIYS